MSDYLVVIAHSAQRQLDALPIEISSRIESKIDALTHNPRPSGCRKLKGRINRWRIRIGDYRIIYSIDNKTFTIKVLEVGHRRDVYEK